MLQNTTTNFVHWEYEDPVQFLPMWFEEADYNWWKGYSAENWVISFHTSLIFLVTIFSLQWWMKTRKAFDLKGLVFLWNMGLGVYSFFAAVRVAQELFAVLSLPDGFHKSLCVRTGLNKPVAFYCVGFALTKFIELGDTLFIVLRKKQLMFLQWYHHMASVNLIWQVFPYSEPISRYYGLMNYGVHSIMYPYFALRVLNIKLPKQLSIFITTCQLLQFVIGLAINAYSMHLTNTLGADACARDPVSYRWINGVYGSFAIIFAHFFFERYVTSKKKTS